MTNLPRSIARNVLALLAVGAGAGAWFEGSRFGLGVVLATALMAGSVLMNWLALRRVGDAMASGRPAPGAAVPFLLKVPMLGAAAWLLLQNFPPLSIVIGGGVIVGGIVLHALSETAAAPREA